MVYLPEAWDRHVNNIDEGRTLRLHQPDRDGSRHLRARCRRPDAPGRSARFDRYRNEEAGEDLRLCYVALTRAKSQVVTWWAPSANTPSSALQRFLYRSVGRCAGRSRPATRLQGDPFSGRDARARASLSETRSTERAERAVAAGRSARSGAAAAARPSSRAWTCSGGERPTPR